MCKRASDQPVSCWRELNGRDGWRRRPRRCHGSGKDGSQLQVIQVSQRLFLPVSAQVPFRMGKKMHEVHICVCMATPFANQRLSRPRGVPVRPQGCPLRRTHLRPRQVGELCPGGAGAGTPRLPLMPNACR